MSKLLATEASELSTVTIFRWFLHMHAAEVGRSDALGHN
jgi:hypothetical protein